MTGRTSDGPRRPPPTRDAVSRAERAHDEAAAALRRDVERPVQPQDRAVFLAVARERFSRPRGVRSAWLALPVAAAAAIVLVLTLSPDAPDRPASNGPTAAAPAPPSPLELADMAQTTVLDAEGAPAAARVGAPLPRAARLRTGPEGEATLRDAATATLVVAAETSLRVAAWTPDEAVIELDGGAVRSTVRKRRADQRFEVRTPYAVVRVVGTEFTVTHTAGEATEIRTHEGRVAVETLDGRSLGTVAAGETLRVEGPRLAATAEPDEVDEPDEADEASEANEADRAVRAPHVAPEPSEPAQELATRRAPRQRRAGMRAGGAPVDPARPVGGSLDRRRPAGMRAAAPAGGMTLGDAGSDGPAIAAPAPDPAPEPAAIVAAPPPPPTAEEVVRRARDLLASGDDGPAIAALEAAADRSWRVRATLGDAYRVAGRPADARAAYERALEEAGDAAPEALVADLAALVAASDRAAAAAVWARYLDDWPEGPAAATALWALADQAARDGDRGAAREHHARLLDAHPRSRYATRSLVRLGRLLIEDGDWDAAEALFLAHRGAERADRSEVALVGLLRVRVAQRRFAAARRLVAEHGERFPDGRRAAEVAHLAAAIPPDETP